MTAVLKRIEPTRVELEIDISDEELEAARDRAFRELVRTTRIAGFRPGKAPRRIFEQQYGTMGIEERALDEVVPRIYTQAIDEHALHPIERPQMELLPREEGGPLRFKATVEVRPEITIGDLDALKLEHAATLATDEDVEKALEGLRRESALLVPVDRPAAIGDTVVADYLGTIDGEAFPGGTAEGQQVELLEERFIPGFASGIAGMIAGEERDVEAVFPDNYGETSLAGKTANFHVKLHDVKEPELPALDDEFVARYMPAPAAVDDLKAELRRRINMTLRNQAKNEQADAFVERLLDLHDFALPETMIERELEGAKQQRQYETAAAAAGVDGVTPEDEPESDILARSDAAKRVKTLLLVEAIARREKIQATNAEIEQEITDLARRYGQPRDRIRQAIGDQLHGLVDGIIRSKTLDLLLERALPEASATKTAEE